jgi:hypothetical protein
VHDDQGRLDPPLLKIDAMSTASVRLEHVGAGCNRVVNALHWGACGLLAYAAHNAVVVYHPEVGCRRGRRRAA